MVQILFSVRDANNKVQGSFLLCMGYQYLTIHTEFLLIHGQDVNFPVGDANNQVHGVVGDANNQVHGVFCMHGLD